jgi:hypothetical protein
VRFIQIFKLTGVVCFSTLVSQIVGTTITTTGTGTGTRTATASATTTATAMRTATASATTTTIFSELLGDRLLEHTTDDSAQASNYIATSQLNGKTVGLYFS